VDGSADPHVGAGTAENVILGRAEPERASHRWHTGAAHRGLRWMRVSRGASGEGGCWSSWWVALGLGGRRERNDDSSLYGAVRVRYVPGVCPIARRKLSMNALVVLHPQSLPVSVIDSPCASRIMA
jgi:hypothetical protein